MFGSYRRHARTVWALKFVPKHPTLFLSGCRGGVVWINCVKNPLFSARLCSHADLCGEPDTIVAIDIHTVCDMILVCFPYRIVLWMGDLVEWVHAAQASNPADHPSFLPSLIQHSPEHCCFRAVQFHPTERNLVLVAVGQEESVPPLGLPLHTPTPPLCSIRLCSLSANCTSLSQILQINGARAFPQGIACSYLPGNCLFGMFYSTPLHSERAVDNMQTTGVPLLSIRPFRISSSSSSSSSSLSVDQDGDTAGDVSKLGGPFFLKDWTRVISIANVASHTGSEAFLVAISQAVQLNSWGFSDMDDQTSSFAFLHQPNGVGWRLSSPVPLRLNACVPAPLPGWGYGITTVRGDVLLALPYDVDNCVSLPCTATKYVF